MGDDAEVKACAQICRDCSQSCREMAEKAGVTVPRTPKNLCRESAFDRGFP